jgi:hypothetical protein
MGALKGSISFTRFHVRGDLPEAFQRKYLASIRTRGFKALTPESEDDVSCGWMPIERPYDVEVRYDAESFFFNDYVNLAMRLDRWKFPTAVVKAKMAQAERAYREKHGRERLSKEEKAQLREAVERRLRREGLPTTKIVDVSWNVRTGTLRFWAGSTTLKEHLHELFEKTFGLKIDEASPYTIAVELPLTKGELRDLDTVDPTPLRAIPKRIVVEAE